MKWLKVDGTINFYMSSSYTIICCRSCPSVAVVSSKTTDTPQRVNKSGCKQNQIEFMCALKNTTNACEVHVQKYSGDRYSDLFGK